MAWYQLNNKSSSNMSNSFKNSAWCKVDISTYGGGVSIGNIQIYQPKGTSFNNYGWNIEVFVGGFGGGQIAKSGNISSPSVCTHGYGRNINCGAGNKGIEVVVNTSGISNYPCTFSGASISVPSPINRPTLSDMYINNITDRGAHVWFDITNNGGEAVSSNWTDLFTGTPVTDGNKIKWNNVRDVTYTDLQGNRTYWVRGNATNSAGSTFTNEGSFTTFYNDVGFPGTPVLTHTFNEPIPRAALTAAWTPASAGTDAVAGYKVTLWRNGAVHSSVEVNANTYTYTWPSFETLGFEVGDIVKVSIQPFSKDWNNVKHYKGEFNAPEYLPNDYPEYVKYRVYTPSSWGNYMTNGETAGSTSGQDFRAVQMELVNQEYTGNIEYRSHTSNVGWTGYVSNGATSGNTSSHTHEAIQARLTGQMAQHYELYIRGYARNLGWTCWRKNDQIVGYGGISYRIDAIQLAVIKKSDIDSLSSSFSEELIIVSDKYIKVSEDEGEFIKYKLFLSEDNGEFKEVRKEYFHLLEEEE